MLLNFHSDDPDDITAPPTRAHIVLGLMFPLHILAIIFVTARILVKAKLKKLGVEDVCIVIALSLALALLVLTVVACKYGFGMHTRDMQPEWILPYSKINYISVALGTTCFYFTKSSMLFFYLRLATEPYFRIICHIIIAITSLSSTCIILLNLFGCTPISGAWNRLPDDHSVCITGMPFYYYTAISNIVIDGVLLLLPIPILLRLRLGWRVKLGLVLMFSMGFLISAVSGISFWSLSVSIHSSDIMWDGSYSWMLAMMELNIGIMTACMPAMKLVVKWIRGEKRRGESEDETIGGGGKGIRIKRRQVLAEGTDGSTESKTTERTESLAVQSQDVLLETGVGGIEYGGGSVV